MKYVRNKKNKKIVKEIDDVLVADFVATKEWEETSKDEYEIAKNAPKSKPKDIE